MKTAESITELLQAWGRGDQEAGRRLVPLVYKDLRRRAAGFLRREAPGHILQPTALVHEAYLRLVDQKVDWRNRSQFFAVASQMMRRILVDHARRSQAAKRKGVHVAVEEALEIPQTKVDLVRLDDALTELAALDARQAKIVELRFFGGLTVEETAKALDVSTVTVKRDWMAAKAWLFARLEDD
jgi:RNA polymerase sigma factor (TIGR02999 family)